MKTLFIVLMLFITGFLYAQNAADTITLESNFKGYKFIFHQEQVKPKDVLEIMVDNESAYEEFNASREAFFFGNVFSMIGCGLIIYPFVNSAMGNETNYGPAFAGVCFIGISIPIFRSYNKKTISSIIKYNYSLTIPEQSDSGRTFLFGATQAGLGMKYKF